jgi:hypothetical protein
MLCMSIHGVHTITESVFQRGRHGQESEEGKEERESHQEGGKEDVEAKEVVVSATERLRLGLNPGRKTNLFKASERPLRSHSGIEERQDKIGPLCRRRRLHKGPVFCLCLRWA